MALLLQAAQGQQQDPLWKNAKLKPEDNVYLIGKRPVGKGLDFYSMQKEIAMGRSLADQIMKTAVIVKDPVVNEYINRMAQNLVRNSDAKVAFTVHVIKDPSINAFALPGGFFFVNTGLILQAKEEDEVAAAMAHEIGHVAARHATRNATKGELLQLATIPLIIGAGPSLGGLAVQNATDLIVPLQFERFSRGAEREADWLGTQYLWKAGYDPEGMVREFGSLEELEKEKPGMISRAFASHPQTPDRVAATEREIATILPPRPQYIVTTSEFAQVQARLRKLLKHEAVTTAPGQTAPRPHSGPVDQSDRPPVLQR